jgi:hypothetical protein
MSSFFPRWVNFAFAALNCGEEAIGEKLPLPDSEVVLLAQCFCEKSRQLVKLKLRKAAAEAGTGFAKQSAATRSSVTADPTIMSISVKRPLWIGLYHRGATNLTDC